MKSHRKIIVRTLIFFGACFLLTIISIAYYSDYVIKNKPVRYVIGYITNIDDAAKVAPWFEYYINVDNKKYYGELSFDKEFRTLSYDSLKTYIGKKFLVKYSIGNPEINRMLIKYPVKEGLEQPPEGWDELPYDQLFDD